jgi:hypothetical protein
VFLADKISKGCRAHPFSQRGRCGVCYAHLSIMNRMGHSVKVLALMQHERRPGGKRKGAPSVLPC